MTDHAARRHPGASGPAPARAAAGLPLANGVLGAMLWNDGDDLVVSIDRTDLWDLREVPEYTGPDYRYDQLAALVEGGAMNEIARLFEAPYYRPAPTKLPAGRIRLSGRAADEARLDHFAAEARFGTEPDGWIP